MHERNGVSTEELFLAAERGVAESMCIYYLKYIALSNFTIEKGFGGEHVIEYTSVLAEPMNVLGLPW